MSLMEVKATSLFTMLSFNVLMKKDFLNSKNSASDVVSQVITLVIVAVGQGNGCSFAAFNKTRFFGFRRVVSIFGRQKLGRKLIFFPLIV